MIIKVRNKVHLEIDDFKFKCCIGKNGFKLKHLICDGPHLVRWLPGYELFPHCDQEEPDGTEHEFPLDTKYRLSLSIIEYITQYDKKK